MLKISSQIQIPKAELEFRFARSSGPGGQNVNRRSTQATLRWRPNESPSLPLEVKARLLVQQRHRISKDGVLQIRSQRHRDQGRNVAECLEKLRRMVLEAARAPRPRRATRPTKASQQARLAGKLRRSRSKQLRRKVAMDE